MRVLSFLTALIVASLLFFSYTKESSVLDFAVDKRESTILYSLVGIVDYLHFKPKSLNNKFSQAVFNDYLDNIDGSKRFLIQSEIDMLTEYELEIDDEIDRFAFHFFDVSVDLLDRSVTRAERLYRSLIEGDFDLTLDERLELDGDKLDFANDEMELTDYWRKNLKYNLVSKINSLRENEKYADLSDEELYRKAKEDVKELYDDWFKRMHKTRRADRFDIYINTIMSQFDPHSYYFSPKEKENFDIRMGNKLEGIGAQLQQADDYVKVYSIVPGGPAWKGDALEVDDLIVEVTQEGKESVDITGMRLDDVIRMIRGDKGTMVTLRVKKKDGTYENISIIRDEIILDDAAARSAILQLEESNQRIGYINLPLFYSTFDGGNSCSTDVEEELGKLNGEGVDGVILDLRYNGGGSLPDVISMAGLFIEKGPVLQVKARDKKPQIHYDKDKKVAYDGPLIVLVNEVSASSSEILVGALQDYGRAIIVGGERTFGKGTVQGVYDLDRMISDDEGVKPLGQVKLTTQKFFRINGKSNQLDGVIPNIIWPDQFSFTEYGEQELDEALTNSEIDPLEYNQDVYKVKKLDELQANSSLRIANNSNFDMVVSYGNLLNNIDDNTDVSLNLKTYIAENEAKESKLEPFDELFENPVTGMKVSNLDVDLKYINSEESRTAKNKDFIEGLEKDFYLKEALFIMQDVLSIDARIAKK